MSTFSGLNTMTTALWANRRALDVTGQNIANVNTEGYSRQRADLQAIGGSVVPAFYSTSPGIGAGVNADDVIRIRDAFLEGRGQTERANNARLTVESEALQQVQTAFREPGETGIQSLLADMWSGWEDVANQPGSDAARTQVIKRLETLVGGIAFSDTSLVDQWKQTRDNLGVLVQDVNAAATTIAGLNKAIRGANQSGLPANDLADRRDVLIMKLADQVGATVRPGEYGTLDVVVGGMTLVSGSRAEAIAVDGPTDPGPPLGAVGIVTASGGNPVVVGGRAGGQLTSLNLTIPEYRGKLDTVVQDLAKSLNDGQAAGTDLDGIAGKPILKGDTAATLSVAFTEPKMIAASGQSGSANLDGSNADKISQRSLTDGVDAGYRSMIVGLGVQAAVAIRNGDIQSVITTQVDAARESVAGVNIDEEMTNMLAFQNAYAAAGRMVTAIDETLDVLINRTGLVGR